MAEARLVLMGIFVLLAAILIGFVTWHSEESIRIAGYGLQLIGMIFAIRGLLGIREHFGQPLLRGLFIKWIKRFPRWKRKGFTADGNGLVAPVASMAGRMEGWTPDDPEKLIEQRIEGIIRNQIIIQNRLRKHAISLDELKDSHEKHKNKVAEEQKNMKKQIQSNLESLHTNNLLTSLIGLLWLTVGITMSTLAPELSKWLL